MNTPAELLLRAGGASAAADIWGSGCSKQTATCQRSGTTGRQSVCGRGVHIKLPGAILEGQQAPEDTRSGPWSTQPQIPPSGPARTTFGAPNPFSCPPSEAGPLPGPGLSPPPERALLTLHPQTPPPGSHGDALQPSPSDTGDAGPLGTQQPACLRGSAVWKERDQAGDRPGPTGLGKVAGPGREGASAHWPQHGPKQEGWPHPAPASWGWAPCCQSSHFLPKSWEKADFCQNSHFKPWCLQHTLCSGGTGPSAALCGPLPDAPLSEQQPLQAGERPGCARS